MSVDLTSQFVFPEAALVDFAERGGPKLRSERHGVAQYEIGDFDRGIPYEFFVHQAKNQVQSEEFDMELNDDVEMLRWIITPRKLEPVCRLTDLPHELLKFRKVSVGKNCDNIMVMKHFRDENGDLECVSGLYKEAYVRWKKGQKASGLPLSKWDKISGSEVKTLANEGIFSVEQLASIPEDRIKSRFPKRYWDIHRDAQHRVNAENPSVSVSEIKKYADQILEEKQENSKLRALLETLTQRIDALETPQPKKKLGRPKKIVTQGEIAS